VYLWNGARAYDGYGNPGITTWYHERVYFPSSTYAPTTGNWNLLVEHHNDGGYQAYSCSQELANVVLNVVTDYPVSTNVGTNPRLKMRIMGGATCSPQTISYDFGALKLNHWYDVLYQVTWSPGSTTGQVNAWLDGAQVVSYRGPTLYTRPNGTTSYTFLDLVNYRLHASWNSTIYFGRVKIGATQASVQ
jgi:hypothetical protein